MFLTGFTLSTQDRVKEKLKLVQEFLHDDAQDQLSSLKDKMKSSEISMVRSSFGYSKSSQQLFSSTSLIVLCAPPPYLLGGIPFQSQGPAGTGAGPVHKRRGCEWEDKRSGHKRLPQRGGRRRGNHGHPGRGGAPEVPRRR